MKMMIFEVDFASQMTFLIPYLLYSWISKWGIKISFVSNISGGIRKIILEIRLDEKDDIL